MTDQIDKLRTLNGELCAEINALTAANRALEAELRLARDEVRTVLNNTEEAKLKAEREYEKYREWMDTPRDEAWERELKMANESRDYWHGEYTKLNAVLRDAVKLLNGRGEYTAARKEGGE